MECGICTKYDYMIDKEKDPEVKSHLKQMYQEHVDFSFDFRRNYEHQIEKVHNIKLYVSVCIVYVTHMYSIW